MRPPFPSGRVAVVLADELSGLAELIRIAASALERELGARPEIVERDPGSGPRWMVRLGGSEPSHRLDRAHMLLVTEAPTREELSDALSTLRDLSHLGDGAHPVRDCVDVEEMIARIETSIADSWPSFALRGVDWRASCARNAPRVRAAADPIEAARRWVAELSDAHTAVRPAQPTGSLRYGVRVDGSAAVLWEVPQDSAAFRAGVRPGWRLEIDDPAAVLARTGASSHAKPWVAGLSLLRGAPGSSLALAARGPGGARVRWTETVGAPFDRPWLSTGWTPSGARQLRIHVWAPDAESELDAFFASLDADRLVVDLRGNGGGNLAVASRFRDRFLRGPAVVGSICYTQPGGRLGPWEPLRGAPPATGAFGGRVCFVTDERTYSASEDALLGLQGLEHVRVVGRPSGGGSGRMRRVRLLPGFVLTISTALTRDRRQRTIEASGIPLDRHVPWTDPHTPDPALAAADRWA